MNAGLIQLGADQATKPEVETNGARTFGLASCVLSGLKELATPPLICTEQCKSLSKSRAHPTLIS